MLQRTILLVLVLTAAVFAQTLEDVSYDAVDGEPVRGVLRVPEGDGPFPALLVVHGGDGGWTPERIRIFADPDSFNLTIKEFGKRRWALLSTDFRPGGTFGLEEQDIVAAFRFLQEHPQVDASRICAFGGSHGGHLALRLAQLVGEELSCVAAGSPWITDPETHFFGFYDQPPLAGLSMASKQVIEKNRMQMKGTLASTGTSAEDYRRQLREYSILANADQIKCPVLLVTSKGDVVVPHATIEPLIERLNELSKDLTVHTAANADHGFYMNARSFNEIFEHTPARQAILRFLERSLGTGQSTRTK